MIRRSCRKTKPKLWLLKGLVKIERQAKAAVTALGVNSTTRQWERFALYSGLLYENAVQAIARDVMAEAMIRAENAGYPIVLSVHDEIVAEPLKSFGDVDEFECLNLPKCRVGPGGCHWRLRAGGV